MRIPSLLELYDDYARGLLQKEDFAQSVRLVEAYVFRRAVWRHPHQLAQQNLRHLRSHAQERPYIQSIQAHLLTLPSYRRFPGDEEFKRELSVRDLYNFHAEAIGYAVWENHDRKERVPVHEYTIEHIMPQNENLSAAWREALGSEWQHVQERWLHTLGNLTLTGYNPEYSDHPFIKKRDMQGGFKESPLRLNQCLGTLDTWNEDTIQQRAKRLAAKAVQVWAPPRAAARDTGDIPRQT